MALVDPKEDFAAYLAWKKTPAERLLWSRLKGRALDGLDFRPQQVVRGWIVDFLCSSLRLVVEVDGSSHDERREHDAHRDEVMEAEWYTVVRVANKDIFDDPDEAVRAIRGGAARARERRKRKAPARTPAHEPSGILIAWEEAHGVLSKELRERFLGRLEVEALCWLPEEAVAQGLTHGPKLKDILREAQEHVLSPELRKLLKPPRPSAARSGATRTSDPKTGSNQPRHSPPSRPNLPRDQLPSHCVHIEGGHPDWCTLCRNSGLGSVYITAGGSHYHASPKCAALRAGQAEVASRGGTPGIIETATLGSSITANRWPCAACTPPRQR